MGYSHSNSQSASITNDDGPCSSNLDLTQGLFIQFPVNSPSLPVELQLPLQRGSWTIFSPTGFYDPDANDGANVEDSRSLSVSFQGVEHSLCKPVALEAIETVPAISLINSDNSLLNNADVDEDFGVRVLRMPFSDESDVVDMSDMGFLITERLKTTLNSAAGIDDILLNAGDGDDAVTLPNSLVAEDLLYGVRLTTPFSGGAGDDKLTALEDEALSLGNLVYGGAGQDTVIGARFDDELFGDLGIFGAGIIPDSPAQNDTLIGGAGNDTLYGNQGRDLLEGGLGNDTLFGDESEDTLEGGDGNDDLFGAVGSDRLIGGAGDDILRGSDLAPGQPDTLQEVDFFTGDLFTGNLGGSDQYNVNDKDVISDFKSQDLIRVLDATNANVVTAQFEKDFVIPSIGIDGPIRDVTVLRFIDRSSPTSQRELTSIVLFGKVDLSLAAVTRNVTDNTIEISNRSLEEAQLISSISEYFEGLMASYATDLFLELKNAGVSFPRVSLPVLQEVVTKDLGRRAIITELFEGLTPLQRQAAIGILVTAVTSGVQVAAGTKSEEELRADLLLSVSTTLLAGTLFSGAAAGPAGLAISLVTTFTDLAIREAIDRHFDDLTSEILTEARVLFDDSGIIQTQTNVIDDELFSAFAGTDRNDFISGEDGIAEVFRPGLGADFIFTGEGPDVVEGSLAELDGDTVAGFGLGDTLRIIGLSDLSERLLEIEKGSAILRIDGDGDGVVDSSVRLEGEFGGQRLVASDGAENSVLSLISLFTDAHDETDLPLPGTYNALEVGQEYDALDGNDFIRGNTESDVVNGGAGKDTLLGRGGKDALIGNRGSDDLFGGGGKDTLLGSGGRDEIFGGGGRDEIYGGGGRDKLDAGRGKDTIDGGGGRDLIRGGKSNDTLTGGAGKDTFQFARGDRKDAVTDYNDRKDLIEILDGADRFDDLAISQVGNDAIIRFANVQVKLLNTDATVLEASDFVFS